MLVNAIALHAADKIIRSPFLILTLQLATEEVTYVIYYYLLVRELKSTKAHENIIGSRHTLLDGGKLVTTQAYVMVLGEFGSINLKSGTNKSSKAIKEWVL